MMRVAFIGLGRAAQAHHWPHISVLDNVEIVAGSDPSEAARAQAQRVCRLPFVCADPRELLERVKPDVVNVCAPPDAHAKACLLALEHGAHVYCEKPFVQSLEEADAVIAAAKAAGRAVAVNNQLRSTHSIEASKAVFDSGRLGRLLFLHAWQRMYRTPATEGGWRGTLKDRVLFEFGTHALDLVRHFYEADPVTVYAQMSRSVSGFEADLVNVVTLGFADGRTASIVLDRLYHGPERYLELALDGETGSVRVSFDHANQNAKAVLFGKGDALPLAEDPVRPWGVATGRHFAGFLAALERGEPPKTSAEDNRRVMAVCFAAYESAATGGVVRLSNGSAAQ
jgi:predicted dehydrogenase